MFSKGEILNEILKVQNSLNAENKIINSNFDIWQRGTLATIGASGAEYLADRWRITSGSLIAASRQTFTLGQTDVPNQPKYYHRMINNSGAINFEQLIEGVRTFAGETISLSFWAKSNNALASMRPYFKQDFGTGGTPSPAVVTSAGATFNLTTSWAKYEFTVAIPSIAGKTIGTNDDDSLSLLLSTAIDSYTYDFAQIQVVKGNVHYEYVKPNIDETLRRCQRYYEKSYDIDVLPGTTTSNGAIHDVSSTSTGNAYGLQGVYKVTKRTIPTVVFYSTVSSTPNRARDLTAATDRTVTGIAMSGQTGFAFPIANTQFPVGNRMACHYTADAEL